MPWVPVSNAKNIMFVVLIQCSHWMWILSFSYIYVQRFYRNSLKHVLLVINIGSPPWTLTPTASRDLCMVPHRAVRHHWRWGQRIRYGLEPTVLLLQNDIGFMVPFYIASIYAEIVRSSTKINKLSGASNAVSGYRVVSETYLIQRCLAALCYVGKGNWTECWHQIMSHACIMWMYVKRFVTAELIRYFAVIFFPL